MINYDKKHFDAGIIFIVITVIGMAIFMFFWESGEQRGLSCMGVRSNINNIITLAEKYQEIGATSTSKSKLSYNLQKSLNDNKRLNCKFDKKAIIKKLKSLN